MVLPLLLAAGGMAAAGTMGNRFFQDFADERQQRRQGEILGGILDESQGSGGLDYDLFGQNLLRGGFEQGGMQTIGGQQTHGNALDRMAQQNRYTMGQIGARSSAAKQLAQLQASLKEVNAQPGVYGLTQSQVADFNNQAVSQSKLINNKAQVDHLVEMIDSPEGVDWTGGRAGVMEMLRTSTIPLLQAKFNSGTLNEGEQELFDGLTGKVSGFWDSLAGNAEFRRRQVATMRTISGQAQGAIDAWSQQWGNTMQFGRDPGGNPLTVPGQTWQPPTAQAMYNGIPLYETPEIAERSGSAQPVNKQELLDYLIEQQRKAQSQ